jgi:hypothetical protein
MEKASDGSFARTTRKTAEDEGRRRGREGLGEDFDFWWENNVDQDQGEGLRQAISTQYIYVRASTGNPFPGLKPLISIHNSENGGYLERIG